jgi:hypothetical protein
MKCIALLTCEKAIVDKEGAHSLINVMLIANVERQQVQEGQPPEDISIPHDAVAPMHWWVYTLWLPSSEDVGKAFEQMYQVFWPNNEKLAESALLFTQENEAMQQTTFTIGGFPIGQQGKIRVVTWLHFEGLRVSEMAETYITVNHIEAGSTVPPVK